jgi:predicted ArsR family transcriptional regulator
MGDRRLSGRHRDADADVGRDVPTPESVLGYMRDVNRAVDREAIAAHFGLKPKQVAAQVDALCKEGLIIKCRPGRSRRKARYTAATADAISPETQDAYLGLSELLLGVLVDSRGPDEVGRNAGRQLGKAVLSNDSSEPDDTVAAVESFLESRGFRPTQIGSRAHVAFVLGCCPFEKAALTNPRLVCGLHRALAEGMLEALGGAFAVTDLVARDPRTAGCRLELRAVRQPGARTPPSGHVPR